MFTRMPACECLMLGCAYMYMSIYVAGGSDQNGKSCHIFNDFLSMSTYKVE